jgi:putative endonuclease
MNTSYAYILTNKNNSTLYIGVTSNLMRRIWERKNKFVDSFTCRYRLSKLVYYEIFDDIRIAIQREKRLKGWQRKWKIELIQKFNPNWKDLYCDIVS